jgi:hypothetical protein
VKKKEAPKSATPTAPGKKREKASEPASAERAQAEVAAMASASSEAPSVRAADPRIGAAFRGGSARIRSGIARTSCVALDATSAALMAGCPMRPRSPSATPTNTAAPASPRSAGVRVSFAP